ncbi:Hypothetical_protein [Hexamita inflata]|uniref:Hypothetical_protein n=1 Tax=Hexamita inflata TaxID=28002 RepID=A0ABP1HPS8_9EUKA
MMQYLPDIKLIFLACLVKNICGKPVQFENQSQLFPALHQSVRRSQATQDLNIKTRIEVEYRNDINSQIMVKIIQSKYILQKNKQQHATPYSTKSCYQQKDLQNKLHQPERANGESVRRFDV